MSSKLPPPMKRSVLLKLKLKAILHKSKRVLVDGLAMAFIIGSFGYLTLKAPEIHGLFLRTKVGSKVYMIKGKLDGGGGTGFAVRAPSGQDYIVTNSHVCDHVKELSDDKNSVLVVNDEGAMRRKIISISDETDLCLIEGLPGVSGLPLGSEPGLGQTVAVVGHPKLRPMSVSKGEIVGSQDVVILDYIMKSGDAMLDMMTDAKEGACDLKKNKIEEVEVSMMGQVIGKLRLCTVVTKDAYMSTALIWPGNSGSPVVDFGGRVLGVAFASDGTNWAYIVSLADLQHFLARY